MFDNCSPATHRCNPHLSVRGLKKRMTLSHHHRSMGADATALPAPAHGMILHLATDGVLSAVAAMGTSQEAYEVRHLDASSVRHAVRIVGYHNVTATQGRGRLLAVESPCTAAHLCAPSPTCWPSPVPYVWLLFGQQ